MPDFSTYQPPGVYIEEALTSVINLIGVRPGVVALVGPSRGYRLGVETIELTHDEAGVGVPVTLAQNGIDEETISVTLNGVAVPEDDYTVVAAATESDETTIAGIFDDIDGSVPEELSVFDQGTDYTVQVSYQYTDENYSQPQKFTDFDEVQDQYGPALNVADGTINSPLSFAARFAFQNGARTLVLVSAGTGTTTTAAAIDTAMDKLNGEAFPEVSIVVPIAEGESNGSSVIENLETHVVNSSEDGMFRIGIYGADLTVTDDPTTLAAAAASARVMVAWPNKLHYFDGYNNQTVEIGGHYLAAAYAGRMISLQPQVPLTRKRIFGFSGIPNSVLQTMSRANKDSWSAGGVAVTEINRQGQMIVRHGVSTNTTNIHNREVSLTRAKDTMVALLQETVDGSGLIGSYIDDDAAGRVKSVVAGVLETVVSNDIIIAYQDLKARQLTTDPSVIEVKFQYRPSYPLNYIVISFSINTTTGETTLIEQATGL